MSWLDQPIVGDVTAFMLIIYLLLVLFAALLGKGVNALIRRYLDERLGRKLSKRLAQSAQYLIIGAAAIIGFGSILEQQLTGLLVSLGLVGVAIAFASQQIVQNMLSGVMIAIIRPIEIEDWIELGLSPTTGISRVKEITLMTTVLRDVDGRISIIPNSQIINGKVVNYTKSGFVAITIPLWISPGNDLERIRKIVFEEADKDTRILPKVTGEERTAITKLFERPSIRRLLGPSVDLRSLDPQVNVVDIQGSKTKINVKVWIREVNKKEEIMSVFLIALNSRFKEEKMTLENA